MDEQKSEQKHVVILPEDGPQPQAGDDARETAWFSVDSRWADGVLTLSFDGPERFEAQLIRDGDAILVKASHFMGFEKIVESLR